MVDGVGKAPLVIAAIRSKPPILIPLLLSFLIPTILGCTGTGYLRNTGKDGMVRETVGNSAISKGLGAVLAGIGAAAYHLS